VATRTVLSTENQSQNYLIYDGECVFCRNSVQALKRLDAKEFFTFVPYQNLKNLNLTLSSNLQFDSEIHLYTKTGEILKGPHAIIYILKTTSFKWLGLLLGLPFLFPFTREVYYAFASNRYLFNPCTGKECEIYTERSSLKSHAVLMSVFIIIALLGSLIYGLSIGILLPYLTGSEGAIKFTLASGISFKFVMPILGLVAKGSSEIFISLIYRCLIAIALGTSLIFALSLLNAVFIVADLPSDLGRTMNIVCLIVINLIMAYTFIKLAGQVGVSKLASLPWFILLDILGVFLFSILGVF
jgi:predicted DCC family thiol-disulfide oxidoreductase YuxK